VSYKYKPLNTLIDTLFQYSLFHRISNLRPTYRFSVSEGIVWERGRRVFSVISRSELSSTDIDVKAGVARPLPFSREEDEENVEGPGLAREDEEVWNLMKRSSVMIKVDGSW
jgi:hypothetical protein